MSDRSVSAHDISQSVVVTGSGNAVSLTFGSTGIVLPIQRKQIRPPERRRTQAAGERPRELDILNPEIGRLPLIGREKLLNELSEWLNNDVDISVHAITGRAGSGKTRLAMELCAQVDGAAEVGAWLAGFLSPTELGSAVEILATHEFEWQRPTLLVIDYAGQAHSALARWLDRLAYQSLNSKLRILLLEREAPTGFGWWHELVGSAMNTGAGRRELFWDATLRPFEVPDLNTLEERRQVMAAALQAAKALRGEAGGGTPAPPAGTDASFDEALSMPRFGNPLNLVMAGVLALDREPRAALALRRLDAARRIARRELERFRTLAGGGRAISHIVAFNGLAGGLAIHSLHEALANELAAAALSGDVGALATLLQQELPPRQTGDEALAEPRLGIVQPDLIGEGLIIEAMSGEPAIEAGAAGVVERAYAVGQRHAAEALMRLLQDYAYALEDRSATEDERKTARRLMAWLNHLAGSIVSPEDMEPLAYALPRHTTILREVALALTEQLARIYSQIHDNTGDMEDAVRAAVWLNNLANRLSDLGHRKEALAAAQECVSLRRMLAASNPAGFTPSLAGSLNNLGVRLSNVGRREEALAATQEAVALRRALAMARPHAFMSDLAMSLNNLANHLSDLDRQEEALAPAEEAVALYRCLAAERPDAFTPDLAMALNNLANKFSALGQRDHALADAEENITIRRTLAEANPDAYTPELAQALHNLASSHCRFEQWEQAITAAGEAIALYRALASARLEAFALDLSVSLGLLADVKRAMSEAADVRDALAEAITLLTPVFLHDPQPVAQWMAMHLQRYLELSEELGMEPDMQLIGPVLEMFERLNAQGRRRWQIAATTDP